MYITINELRSEGISETMANDHRLLSLIERATYEIDHFTRYFFEPKPRRYLISGRGGPSIELPVPPIRIDRILTNGYLIPLSDDHLTIVGAPITSPDQIPRITRRYENFPKGDSNIFVEGIFGYTEPNGTPEGETPPLIRHLCALLVLRNLPPIAHEEGFDARNRWRIIEERTRDQSYKLDRPQISHGPTGDPEIDSIMWRYRRPSPLGAV